MRQVISRTTLTVGMLAAAMVWTACSDGMMTVQDDKDQQRGLGHNSDLAAPASLSPSDGERIATGAVRLESGAVGGASSYEFQIEYYQSNQFRRYYTYSSRTNAKSFWPATQNRVYRFRVRAKNYHGYGSWSDWAQFDYGTPTSRPEGSSGSQDDESGGGGQEDGSQDDGQDGGDEEDGSQEDQTPNPGAPTGMTPSDAEQIWSSSVKLDCDDYPGATRYQFKVQYYHDATNRWRTYYTYAPYSSYQNFWPRTHNAAYRWKVRAYTSGGWQPWSNWQVFLYGDADNPNTSEDETGGSGNATGNCSSTQSRPTSWTWPTPQTTSVCQHYGVSIDYQDCGFHTGTDLCGTTGEPILSMAAGEVVHVGEMWLSGSGVGRGRYSIVVKHGPNLYTTYGHNDSSLVEEGDCVEKGQRIATMGDRGYSYSPHLHVELVDGTPFTGDWETPFHNFCSNLDDPTSKASP